ncbi:MAG: LysE family transporter [Pseudomonadota bacterium]
MFPVIPFTIYAASQVGTPGPANMAILAMAARYGTVQVVPFTLGVIFGKQFVIWPLGFGLLELSTQYPLVFSAMTYVAAAYICYLAWRVAGMSLNTDHTFANAPGFWAGLIVHPMNPKAWAVITAGFAFVPDGMGTFVATAWVAGIVLACQLVLQPMWAVAGDVIARTIKGTRAERILFITLALLTVASVIYALFVGT